MSRADDASRRTVAREDVAVACLECGARVNVEGWDPFTGEAECPSCDNTFNLRLARLTPGQRRIVRSGALLNQITAVLCAGAGVAALAGIAYLASSASQMAQDAGASTLVHAFFGLLTLVAFGLTFGCCQSTAINLDKIKPSTWSYVACAVSCFMGLMLLTIGLMTVGTFLVMTALDEIQDEGRKNIIVIVLNIVASLMGILLVLGAMLGIWATVLLHDASRIARR